jgi:hypothetical protein
LIPPGHGSVNLFISHRFGIDDRPIALLGAIGTAVLTITDDKGASFIPALLEAMPTGHPWTKRLALQAIPRVVVGAPTANTELVIAAF